VKEKKRGEKRGGEKVKSKSQDCCVIVNQYPGSREKLALPGFQGIP